MSPGHDNIRNSVASYSNIWMCSMSHVWEICDCSGKEVYSDKLWFCSTDLSDDDPGVRIRGTHHDKRLDEGKRGCQWS